MNFNIDELKVLFYSTFFIVIVETILLKISPQLFSLLGFLPIFFIGFLVELRIFFLNLIISSFLLAFANLEIGIMSGESMVISSYLLVFIFFSSLSLLFFVFLKFSQVKKISFGRFLSNFNFVCNLMLVSFIFFFFSNLNLEEINLKIIDSVNRIFDNSNINEQIKITDLVEHVVTVLPSINFLVILITLSMNCLVSQTIILKSNLSPIYEFNFNDSIVPKSFLIFFTLSFLSLIFLPPSLQIYINNVLILSSFCFFADGIIFFLTYLKNFEINKYIKFIFIFLLFVFLGYVLFLFIFFLGYYRSCRKIFFR